MKHPGESILEVMIAIVILAAVLTSTFILVGQAITVNTNVKNRIVALNIAREGIEGVRQIRDTNWVRFSGNKRANWNCIQVSSDPNGNINCAAKANTQAYFTLGYDFTNYQFKLTNTNHSQALNAQEASTFPETYRLYRQNGRLTHNNSGNKTQFFRQIYLEPSNPISYTDKYNEKITSIDPDICNENGCSQARINIISRVQWIEDERLYEIILEGFLYDFFQRKSYE